jgi:penicillin-insensitive murein endopeptidase
MNMLFPMTIFFLFFLDDATANPWAIVSAPSQGIPRIIGETTNGCIHGAVSLPHEGIGYVVMHLERKRFFGHPLLIRAIETLGRTAIRGIGLLQIGDLGQPRGGPMPFGHRSHQTGLDVDIWYNLDPSLYVNTNGMRSNITAPSLLNSAKNSLDRHYWSHRHGQLLKAAASLPEVDRIFVNPYIKRELCLTVRFDRGWLHKIRPWYGHDDHFHMRLACPIESTSCVRQEPVPPGEGCDASLDWWLHPEPPGPAKPAPAKPVLPSACGAVLKGR